MYLCAEKRKFPTGTVLVGSMFSTILRLGCIYFKDLIRQSNFPNILTLGTHYNFKISKAELVSTYRPNALNQCPLVSIYVLSFLTAVYVS